MLGVNASQTSRWAKGDERPGPQVAPLLIDREHVLARVRLVWSEPAATVWMTSANARLDGARPADVLALRPRQPAGRGRPTVRRDPRRSLGTLSAPQTSICPHAELFDPVR
jgi:hypothetical protein